MRATLLYWSQGDALVNFGDYATHALLERLGLEVALASRRNAGEPVLFGAGTMLSDYWLRRRAAGRRVVVWGSGYGGADLTLPLPAAVEVRAVRGPISRRKLGLPADTPLGDPALLLPRVFPAPARPHGESVYVPHWKRAGEPAVREFADYVGASRVVSPLVERAGFAALLADLAGASLVQTSSLHGAIVAQAYGVPWRLALAPGEPLDLEAKWRDFAEFLGAGLGESAEELPDLGPLERAFPFPIFGDPDDAHAGGGCT